MHIEIKVIFQLKFIKQQEIFLIKN